MTTDAISPDRIGPQVSLADVVFPDDVAVRLGALYDADGPVETAAEWVTAMRTVLDERRDRAPGVEDLCTTAESRHVLERDGERQAYVCVLDPLIEPFLRNEPGTVHSVSPASGDPVTVDIGPDGATARPETAVVSLGVADDDSLAEREPTLELVYRQVCAYVHAFPTPADYEAWAAETGGVTTAVPVETGVGLAGELSREFFAENQ